MNSACRLKKTSARAHWRDRLAEMLVAGGTLAVVGCASSANESKHQGQNQNQPDATTSDSGLRDAGPNPRDAPVFTIPCGNANADPCICDRPKTDPVAAVGCKNKTACEAKGGVWGYSSTPEGQCLLADSGPIDAGFKD